MSLFSQAKNIKSDSTGLFKLAAIIYTFALAALVFLNGHPETRPFFRVFATIQHLDKFGHFFIMGSFSYLVNLALNAKDVQLGSVSYLKGSLIVLTIVSIEEFSQLFLATRTFELTDMFFNTVGIIMFGELARTTIVSAKYLKSRLNTEK